jgi:hypothetical protein
VFIEMFRKAIIQLAVSASTPIVIITSFIFLSHFSGLGNMVSVLVIHHFAQIPGIMHLMSPLGLLFHKVLLRSFLPLFRDSLNVHIVAIVRGTA